MLTIVIVTLACALIIQNLLLAIWGPNFFSYTMSSGRSVDVLSMTFTVAQLAIIGISLAAMFAIHLLLSFSKLGKAMRATASNAALARSCGIRTDRIIDLTWLISGALCGLSGVVLVMNTTSLTAGTGAGFLLVIAAAAIHRRLPGGATGRRPDHAAGGTRTGLCGSAMQSGGRDGPGKGAGRGDDGRVADPARGGGCVSGGLEVGMTEPPILEVAGLAAGYGAAPIVSDVSPQVGRGEIVSILGPNGAGKSTLLKALVGVIRALQGPVRLDGQTVTNLSADTLARLGLGYVPQVNDVFDALSVAENLEMGGYLLGKREFAARRAEVLAMLLGLQPILGRNAGKLSGGERKLLAVGRVLMPRPKILILDEPTANLSPQLAAILLRDQVRQLAADGTAVLLVEQKAMAALEISDRAYILVAGRTRIEGPAAELLARRDIGELFLGRSAV
ncbi:MAG TPA: ATP-binding cassette domain-containing protein [Chloroflexota bacterium]|nr:ATP-binding cassette domain-containing protein [Chloroflexota bacterium]